MTDTKLFILAHETARKRACQAVAEAPQGFTVRLSPPVKKRIQEEKYHAQINDIAAQVMFFGRKWPADDVKRILVDDFAEVMRQAGTPLHHDSRVTPSLDGRRIVQLGIQTREFYVAEASAFIEYLNALGAEYEVVWSGAEREMEAV
jgi:hypothetical protein